MTFFFFLLIICCVECVRVNNSNFISSAASFKHHSHILSYNNVTVQHNVTANFYNKTSSDEWSIKDSVVLYLMVILSLFVGYLLLICIKQPTWMEHKYKIIKKR